ncbi:MAG: DUF2225 domain-containing protein [Oscillospiraceae bacterium]|nr:DUF2225 domain-containing protein [Oscillospiraceae bacterium]
MNWVEALSGAGTQMSASTGDVLYYAGSPSTELFLVISGEVGLYLDIEPSRTRAGSQIKAAAIQAGGFFAAEGFMEDGVRLFTAKAETSSRLLLISKAILPIVTSSSDIMKQLLSAISSTQSSLKEALSTVIAKQNVDIDGLSAKVIELQRNIVAPPPPPPKGTAIKAPPLRPAPPIEKKAVSPPPAPVKPAAAPAKPAAAPAASAENVMFTLLPPGHPLFGRVAPEEESRFIGKKAFTCGCCQATFNDANVLSYKLKTREIKSDMRIIHEGIETLWYSVRVCPQCNMAALTPVFAKYGGREAKLMRNSGYAAKVPRFKGYTFPRALDEVIESYYLALACVLHIDNDPINRAQLWRRLMWLYDDAENVPLQNMALDNALEAYREAYQQKYMKASESFQISVVMGDLYSRKGDRNNAYKAYFDAVHGEDKSNQILLRHAQDMMTHLRHGSDKD